MPNTNAAAFDASTLTVETAEMPASERANAKPNPFVDTLVASYEEWTADKSKGGRKVTVPNAGVGTVKYLIRDAARRAGIGSRIVEQTDKPRKGQTTILFSAKDAKKSKATTDAAPEPAADAPADES